MGKKKSWLHLFLVLVMLFQYSSSAVYAVANEKDQPATPPVHVVSASEQKEIDEKQVEALVQEAGIGQETYTIQKPIALFLVTQEELVEEYYYPVISQKKLAALIRYAPKTDSYRLETEQVVNELAAYQTKTTNTAPLLLLVVENQMIGKDETSIYNFSTPEMPESEKERLFLQADVSKINLSNTMDLYEEMTDNEEKTLESTENIDLEPESSTNQESTPSEVTETTTTSE